MTATANGFSGQEPPHPLESVSAEEIVDYLSYQDADGRYDYFTQLYDREEPYWDHSERETPEHELWRSRRAAASFMILDRATTGGSERQRSVDPDVVTDFLDEAIATLRQLYPQHGEAAGAGMPEHSPWRARIRQQVERMASRSPARRFQLSTIPTESAVSTSPRDARASCGRPVIAAGGAPCVLYPGHEHRSHCRSR